MTSRAIVAGLFILTATSLAHASDPAPVPACLVQAGGHTSDQPPDPVVVCRKLFPTAPFVRLPQDQRAAGGQVTLYGVVDLDVSVNFHIQSARFFDRQLSLYPLVNSADKPIDESSDLMKKNHLPSNRVHFLVYEAKGTILPSKALQLTGLRPVILVEGQAIDERFLGPWEGLVSKRRTPTEWYTDTSQPVNFAKIRVNFAPPLAATDAIGELKPTPKLPDGQRFKVPGKFENATQPVRLSTGECAPALTSYGASNPFPDTVSTSDYLITMWRFPAMHSLWSKDFHIVFDYPKNLHPDARAMASEHNFRLKDYIATSTHPEELVFRLHGNPVNQIVFVLKPVQGGGGSCK
jgi:hypothetical protein